jgi:hypothetical protein
VRGGVLKRHCAKKTSRSCNRRAVLLVVSRDVPPIARRGLKPAHRVMIRSRVMLPLSRPNGLAGLDGGSGRVPAIAATC